MSTHYTYKGKPVDMGALLMMNQHAVALGNANLNARGDLLGQGGEIMKTAEQITEEYYQQQTAQVVSTNEEEALSPQPNFAPQMETVDMSLLSGYSEDPIEPVEPVEPKRRKAPTAGE